MEPAGPDEQLRLRGKYRIARPVRGKRDRRRTHANTVILAETAGRPLDVHQRPAFRRAERERANDSAAPPPPPGCVVLAARNSTPTREKHGQTSISRCAAWPVAMMLAGLVMPIGRESNDAAAVAERRNPSARSSGSTEVRETSRDRQSKFNYASATTEPESGALRRRCRRRVPAASSVEERPVEGEKRRSGHRLECRSRRRDFRARHARLRRATRRRLAEGRGRRPHCGWVAACTAKGELETR